MMSVLSRATLAFVPLLLAACAVGPNVYTHTMPSADFSDYETFGWPDEFGTDRGGYETSITRYFKAAARHEMEELGYEFVEDEPDLLVNFYTRVEPRQETVTRSTMGPTFATGYYGYRYGLYGAWPVYATEVDTFQYNLGTANIDLVDASQMRLVWEGRVEGRLTDRSMSNPKASIAEAVEAIFERFPTRLPQD
jgi:hypothetical protein